MKLCDLIKGLPFVPETRGDLDTEILGLTADSRAQMTSGLFFCFEGGRFDSHRFAAQAVANGCAALSVERFLDDVDVPQIKVPNGRAAMSLLSIRFYGNPADSMMLIGITGTKGKTTSSYMLKAICEKAGYKCGLIGTTGNMIGSKMVKSQLTTPEPIDLQRTLREMADAGVQVVCMEVSAHAMAMCRLEGLRFKVGCFTNFSQDHLDYFETMDQYFAAKQMFFTGGMVENAVVNIDDERADQLIASLKCPVLTYGICRDADLFARDCEMTESGNRFDLLLHGIHQCRIETSMSGSFNVYNAMSAAGCAMTLGIGADAIREGLMHMGSVPGRIETLETHTPYKVILDYAHSPDSLKNILKTVRAFTRGRLIAVFGCGGDRDKGKRPIMGTIAAQISDFCILTSDNPRNEDPMDILAAIEKGTAAVGKPYVVIENRREAIRYALEHGEDGDVIVLAGKGHETYQDIKGVKYPFDEKIVVQELLNEMHQEEMKNLAEAVK